MDIENIFALLDRECEVGEAVDAVFTFAPTCNVSIMKLPIRYCLWAGAYQSQFSHSALAWTSQSRLIPNRPSVNSFSYVFGPILDSFNRVLKSLSCCSGTDTVKGAGVDLLSAGRLEKDAIFYSFCNCMDFLKMCLSCWLGVVLLDGWSWCLTESSWWWKAKATLYFSSWLFFS